MSGEAARLVLALVLPGRRRPRSRARETDAMLRATVVRGKGGGGAQARRWAGALSPVAVSPAAPRETMAVLDAWGPSLMPRSARARGGGMGLWVLGQRASSGGGAPGRRGARVAGGGAATRRPPAAGRRCRWGRP